MPRLLFLYFSKRIAAASLMIAAGLCIPVVLASLFHDLPPAALRGGLLVPALLGTLPTVLYIALPMAVGVAVALEFARMSAEGMVAVLYSLRLSVWAVTLPPAFVAILAAGIGYWLSSFFAPAHVGEMHDVIYVIRNSMNHRMLEPAQFYTLDNGMKTLYFRSWRSADVVSGLFIHERLPEKSEERTITAAAAEFRRNPSGVVLIMSNGSIETAPSDGSKVTTAHFDEYAMPITMQGSAGLPQRDWRGVFEWPFAEFFEEKPSPEMFPRLYGEWMSEAAKRFGIPILALTHALLAIGLILSLAPASGRSPASTATTLFAIPSIHVGVLISAETLVRHNPHLVFIVAIAILAEFTAALVLIARQNAMFPELEERAAPAS
ncbi:MAG TPA: LptF/LptG family permease [Methylocella sp.]|nr:LptF/LptG family permease [Methylocella sp.]